VSQNPVERWIKGVNVVELDVRGRMCKNCCADIVCRGSCGAAVGAIPARAHPGKPKTTGVRAGVPQQTDAGDLAQVTLLLPSLPLFCYL
jgi:hypothetical protein